MEMTGEYTIFASREKVYEALNDRDILAKCIPGCQELNKDSDTELSAVVKSKVGPVSATFKGKVTISEMDPPNGYKIFGEGSGGVAGFAKGGAEVKLVADGENTALSYVATAQVGGKLAQIGSRLIDSTAKKMANEFFGKFAEEVGGGAVEAAVPAPASSEKPAEAVPAAAAKSSGGLSPAVWVGGLIVAVVVVLILLAS